MLHVREGWLQRIDVEPGAGVVGEEFGFGGSEIAVAGEYAPVYELAGAVNKFYHETRILGEEDKALQAGYIALIGLAKRVLEQCIDLLAFSAPEKM